jgi:hypothetical protein
MIIYLVECLYIIFILIFFKTKYSFHHPLEIYIQKKTFIDWISHPLQTNLYENKICFLGHIFAIVIVLWIIFKNNYKNKTKFYIKKVIWILTILIGFILNFNFFIYLIPRFINELIILK